MPMRFPLWLQMADKSLSLHNPKLLPDFIRNRTQASTIARRHRVFYVTMHFAKQQLEIAPVTQDGGTVAGTARL